MKIQYKATVWMEIDINDEGSLDKVIDKLNAGDSVDDLYSYGDIYISGSEVLYDTEELMSPHENDNNETIVVYGENWEKIWDNSIESQVKRLTNGK